MGDFYAKTILEYPPTYRRNKIKFVDNTTFRDNKNKFIDEYHEKIEFPWLSEHNLSPTERNIIDEFYNSLTRGKESLTESVKEALSFWKKLI